MKDAQYVLLRKTTNGIEKCDIPPGSPGGSPHGCNHTEVKPGKGTLKDCILGPGYHEHLNAGETYVFFWPGARIMQWDRSTRKEHTNMKDCYAQMRNQPQAILPASNFLGFTVIEESEPWPEREKCEEEGGFWEANLMEQHWRQNKDKDYRYRLPAPGVLTEEDREPAAPVLTRKMEGPPILNKYGTYEITETTTYDKSDNNQDAKPIIFLDKSTSCPNDDEDEDFYSLLPESGKGLETLYSRGICRLGEFLLTDKIEPVIPDNKVEEFVVGDERFKFHTLYPGDSITSTTTLHPDGIYEEGFEVGEKYTYRFNGKVLRWWDWGTLEDHKGTRISGFDQAPKIVIPTVSHDFTVTI